MLESVMAILAVLAGAAATYVLQAWRAAREQRDRLLTGYLAQLQDACETSWYRVKNLAYDRADLASDPQYLVITTMYTLGRALGLERMLVLEGRYPEIWSRFPELRETLRRRVLDEAVNDAMKHGHLGLQHYDRVALGEAAVERHGEGFRPSTFLEFRRRIEGPDRAWWEPARTAVTALQDSGDAVDPLLSKLQQIAVALATTTKMESPLAGARADPDR